jgi:hypothetical protein
MKGAKALIACLVLALLAGRASAAFLGKSCVIKQGAASSCSYYSEALGMQLSLTQACVPSEGVFDSTNMYYPPAQPWYGRSLTTVKAFLKEVGKSCDFGYPNLIGVNKSPLACYKLKTSDYYYCHGVTKKNKVKPLNAGSNKPGNNKWRALLSALN